MRTQTRMFSASSLGRRDTENVNVANEHAIREVVRKISRKTRSPPSCEVCEEKENSWILMLGLDSLLGDGDV